MPKLKQNEMHMITRIVTSENGEKTFSYTKELQGVDGDRAILIMLYPTRNTDNYHVEDSTSMHIQDHMRELGLSSYTVVNLFGAVTKSRLSVRGLVEDEENLIYIKEQVLSKISGDDTKFIIAWGNSHLTSHAVNQAKRRFLELWMEVHPKKTLYQLTTDGLEKGTIGTHPLYLGIRHSSATWKLETYPIEKEFSKLCEVLEEKKQRKPENKKKRSGDKKEK